MRVVVETEHLLFRDHGPEDMEPYCAMEADPEVRRYVGGAARSRDEAEACFREYYLPPAPDRLTLWATVHKPTGCYIGYCGVYAHFDDDGSRIQEEGVLAFYLARSHWGQGLATEAGRAFLRFGFTELGLSRIVASVEVGNHASTRVMGKLGLHHTGTKQINQRSFHYYERHRASWKQPGTPLT